MSEEQKNLIIAILENPTDIVKKKTYVSWLHEHNHEQREQAVEWILDRAVLLNYNFSCIRFFLILCTVL